MRILLDTCTFLWIAEGSPRLSERAADLCSDAENSVYLSAVTAWEIAVKHGLGKLRLPGPPSVFVPEARIRLGFTQLPLSEAVAVALDRLPMHHRDPSDRLLVCQALLADLTIVTPDPKIRRYPVTTDW